MNALGILKDNSAAGCKQIIDYFSYSSRDLMLYALGVGCSVGVLILTVSSVINYI